MLRRSKILLAIAATALAAAAHAQRPGPAPIVVTGSGSGPVKVSQGGQTRTVKPSSREPVIAQSTGYDSAWDVPEDELLQEDEYFEEPPVEEQYVDETGYQPSSDLNHELPGAEPSQFSEGYAPSSTLNERMAAQAMNQTTAWDVGEGPGVVYVQQWSTRGIQSRRGMR